MPSCHGLAFTFDSKQPHVSFLVVAKGSDAMVTNLSAITKNRRAAVACSTPGLLLVPAAVADEPALAVS